MNLSIVKRLAAQLLLALFVGLGGLALWVFGGAIIVSCLQQWFEPGVYEYIHVLLGGQVAVQEYHRDGSFTVYRTLDGQAITDNKSLELTPACSVPIPSRYPTRLPWNVRLIGCSDAQLPRNLWYLITDGLPEGHGYFVGYNIETKQLIGYLGLSGFQTEVPPVEKQFTFPSEMLNRTGAVVGSYSSGTTPGNYVNGDIMHVLSGGKLFLVNLNRRSVEPVDFPDEIESIAWASEVMGEATETGHSDYEIRVGVRTKDKLVFLDLDGKTRRTISIPVALRDKSFEIYTWWTPLAVFVTREEQPQYVAHIDWVDQQNVVTRHLDVPLRGAIAPHPALTVCVLALIVPGLVPLAVALLFIVPLSDAFYGRQPDYTTALSHWAAYGWPALLVMGVLGIILALVCYRQQRTFSKDGIFVWPIFVAILGVPGFVGYWLHRRWPPVERCSQCGAITPRDRDACLACSADFSPPAMKGIEIFA